MVTGDRKCAAGMEGENIEETLKKQGQGVNGYITEQALAVEMSRTLFALSSKEHQQCK